MSTDETRQRGCSFVLQDHFLWEMVCRTTIPLHGKPPSFFAEDTANIENKKQHITQTSPFLHKSQHRKMTVEGKKRADAKEHEVRLLDRVTYRKISRGHYPIEARLDLHGCTQGEAYFSLKKFLQSSQQRGLRYVLVITGKGRSPGSDGILFQFVPHWLSTPAFKYYVHEFEQASHQHGGCGALYIRLRFCAREKRVL
ncbi:Smr/MutS family protein [Bartonella sp. CB189]|uniref:Smr/MutS family protein n=1 Tax=Bartonella sp. CB189 TaxID=3112254 RepID=UPI002F96AD55